MATTVRNVRDLAVGAAKHESDVYIGRAARRARVEWCRAASAWANPFALRVREASGRLPTVEEIVEKFEVLMHQRLANGGKNGRGEHWLAAKWREELLKLDGCILWCWCEPDPCHGHVLVKLIDEVKGGRL